MAVARMFGAIAENFPLPRGTIATKIPSNRVGMLRPLILAIGTQTTQFSWNRGEAPDVEQLHQRNIADLSEFFGPVY